MNSTSPWPPDAVLFLDKCLGRFDVSSALKKAGVRVELHHDHFEHDAEDSEWLPVVGSKGWIVLSKDRHFRHNYLEVVAMFKGNVKAFVLTGSDMTGPSMGLTFVAALPDIFAFAERFDAPFIASVTETSAVHMVWHKTQLYEAFIKGNPPPKSRKSR